MPDAVGTKKNHYGRGTWKGYKKRRTGKTMRRNENREE